MGVFRRNDYWCVDYYDDRGKRHRQKIGSRKKDAEEALAQIKIKIASGDFVPPKDRDDGKESCPEVISFHEFVAQDYLPWSQTQHSVNHHVRQKRALNAHLLPYLKGCSLGSISPKLVERYKTRRCQKANNATINRELSCLKQICKLAVRCGYLEEDPTRDVTILKETPAKKRLLEGEEIAALLNELPDRLKALIACAAYAGLRRAELFSLRWEDVGLNRGELRVVPREHHPTKNNKTRRIPLNHALVEAIKRHPRHFHSPYVFSNSEGKRYDNVRKALLSASQRAGIEGGVALHQLRHAFCSHCLMSGVDAHTVLTWMGHKSLTTTLKYAHTSPEHEKAAIQLLRYDSRHHMDTAVEQN
jgi:integrase